MRLPLIACILFLFTAGALGGFLLTKRDRDVRVPPTQAAAMQASARDASPRPADQILKEFKKTKGSIPAFQPDGMSTEAYTKLVDDACNKMRDLAWEFYRAYPEHEKTKELMETRWSVTMGCFKRYEDVFAETSKVIEHGMPAGILPTAYGLRAQSTLDLERFSETEKLAFIDEAHEKGFGDGWTVALYGMLALEYTSEPETQRTIIDKALKLKAREDEEMGDARALDTALKRIGEVVELRFDDALTARPFDLADQRGKWIIVVDWYAHLWEADKLKEDEMVNAVRAILKERGTERDPERDPERVQAVFVYGASDPATSSKAVEFARRLAIDWPLYLDPSEPWNGKNWFGQFAVNGPQFVLIDPAGKVAALSRRAAPLGRFLATHMK